MKISIPIQLRAALIATLTFYTVPLSHAQDTVHKTFTPETTTEPILLGGNKINNNAPIGETSADFDKNIIIDVTGLDYDNGSAIGGNFLNNSYPDDDPLWGKEIHTSANFDGFTQINVNNSKISMAIGGNLTYFYDGNTSSEGATMSTGYHGAGRVSTNFEGDSTITVDATSSVGFVVGGNFGNSNGSSFTGNTNITSNQAYFSWSSRSAQYNNHGIVGASVATNESNINFTGNTNVTLTGMLAKRETLSIYGSTSSSTISGTYGSVIGGLSGDYRRVDLSYQPGQTIEDSVFRVLAQDMTDQVGTLKGNTNVTINHKDVLLEDPTQNNFIYSIIGGSVAGNGMDINHVKDQKTGEEGVVNLDIFSQDSINFQKAVVGGNVNLDAEAVAYTGNVILMRENLSETITSEVNVHVTGGNFAAQSEFSFVDPSISNPYDNGNMFISGSLSFGGGKVTTTEVVSTIDGGIFDVLVGANASTASMETNVQSGSSWQQSQYQVAEGGLYAAYGVGPGSSSMTPDTTLLVGVDYTSGSMHSEKVTLTVNGGNTNLVVAGNYIASDVTHITGGIRKDDTGQAVLDSQGNAVRDGNIIETLVSTLDSAHLMITGGTHQNITGGSFIGANITTGSVAHMGGNHLSYEAEQGDITITLSGADTVIKGDFIAAAGIIETFSKDAFLARYISSKYAKLMYEAFFKPDNTGTAPLPEGDLAFNAVTEATLKMTTDSTSINLGADVRFETNPEAKVTISGGYKTVLSDADDTVVSFINNPLFFSYNESIENFMAELDTYKGWFGEEWGLATDALIADFASITQLEANGLFVTGNRLLNLSDSSSYNNISNVDFVDFDEVNTGSGAVVDFGLNGQDLDSFEARNKLAAGTTRIDTSAAEYMKGTNTLRKTGEGTLILGVNNGQVNAEDNLQLVVEQGTLVLAAGSHTKTDFQTLVIQNGSTTGKGATLDISRASYSPDGEYQSNHVGINGLLMLEASTNLEQMLNIVADASRDAVGSGAMMTGGALNIVGEGQITLNLINSAGIDYQQAASLTEGSHFLFGEEDFYEIVLFSALDVHNLVFDSTLAGTLNGVDAFAVAASVYLSTNSNFNVEDAYLVYSGGDLMITGALYVPEPSTATLSILALAGLLARRRRK